MATTTAYHRFVLFHAGTYYGFEAYKCSNEHPADMHLHRQYIANSTFDFLSQASKHSHCFDTKIAKIAVGKGYSSTGASSLKWWEDCLAQPINLSAFLEAFTPHVTVERTPGRDSFVELDKRGRGFTTELADQLRKSGKESKALNIEAEMEEVFEFLSCSSGSDKYVHYANVKSIDDMEKIIGVINKANANLDLSIGFRLSPESLNLDQVDALAKSCIPSPDDFALVG